MIFTDTHAHLYDEQYADDIDTVISDAVRFGVTRILLPGVESASHRAMLDLADRYPDILSPMIGVHPTNISQENIEHELCELRYWLGQRKFVAIGEIGLDLYWDKSTIEVQIQAFRAQLEMALEYHLPVSIHSRDAFDQTFEILSEQRYRGVKGVLHCFGGTQEQAHKIIDLGYKLGIGGAVTYKNNPLKEVLKTIGISHMVLETDAPYLSPVPYRGKRNQSSYVVDVAGFIAQYLGVTMEEVSRVSQQNVEDIFGKKIY